MILRAVILLLLSARIFAASPGVDFFERKIRPLLAENCFSCHGEEKQKGELRLDSPGAIRAGGSSGPAFVAGKPGESLMIRAVSYQDEDLKMPPKKRLSEKQVADLTEWVAAGAPMPAGEAVHAKKEFEITEADRKHWAFQPVTRPKEKSIDAILAGELKQKKLAMSKRATPRELVRRIYFDLIGLPPSPEAVAQFEKNPSSEAYERIVDDLLARPQYGERWARHWLDIVRFAQSDGYERDAEKPLAWRYRDYVIDAFNNDKPYDRFIKEQIAGDELPDASAETVTATGFQRLGVFDDEPDDKLMAEYDALDDVLSTTGSAFLGLTLGCARCHDHKFDPIPQAEYYSMLAFFRNVQPYHRELKGFDSAGFAPLAAPIEAKRWREKNATNAAPPFEWTLAVRENGTNAPETRVLARGNPASPGAQVAPAFLKIIAKSPPQIAAPAHGMSSGRRLALAEWIASGDNPLTARVMVNRVWQHHFGRGLVKTTSDFGKAGSAPSHPALLDFLAAEFIDSGWSLKKLHKLILLSRAYQQSSRAENARATNIDPGNELFWRQNLRRLEAESIRDSILAVAGTLNPKMGGRGFFPHLSGEVLAGQSRPGLDWIVSTEAEKSRRSIYAFVRRTMPIPLLETLDYSNTTSPLAERTTTTVAPQSLILLNDDFLHEQAKALATRLRTEAGDQAEKQVRRAYELALNRAPTSEEMEISRSWIKRQTSAFEGLRSRVTFRPDVSNALSTDYFGLLRTGQFYIGPTNGWTYHRGFWAPPYEGIRVVDPDRSPFALFGGVLESGVFEGEIEISSSTESASLLLRGSAESDEFRGYELHFDPRSQKISLRKHDGKVTVLSEASAALPVGKPISVKATLHESRLTVEAAQAKLSVSDTSKMGNRFGVRSWGGAMTLSCNLGIRASEDASFRALQSFALLVLNLNEFVYVD